MFSLPVRVMNRLSRLVRSGQGTEFGTESETGGEADAMLRYFLGQPSAKYTRDPLMYASQYILANALHRERCCWKGAMSVPPGWGVRKGIW